MQKPSLDFHDLFQMVLLELHAAWRYRWHALIVTWCVATVGALMVLGLPNKYESTAQVYADTNVLTSPLLKGIAVQPDISARLQVITRTLLARPNLETVANKTGLGLRASTPAAKDELLQGLGASVQIKGAGADNLYNVSYDDVDPQMAQKVVQNLVQILMNDTLGVDAASNEAAQTFLQQQVNDYNDRLNAAAQKLADFQKANVGYMPGSTGDSVLATRLQDAQSRLQQLQGEYAAVLAGRGVVGGHSLDPRVRDIDQQLAAYQQKLNALLLTYTNEYPDVVAARHSIAQLQARRTAVLNGTAPAPVAGGAEASHATAPAAGGNSSAARAVAAQVEAQKQVVAGIRSGIDKIADAQATVQELTRNYDTTKKQYDELVTRLNTAQLSQDAAQSGNNLKFRVVSPPIVPLLPVSPKRGLLLVMVLVVALGIGAGFAYFMHKIRPVFLSQRSLRDISDFPVLGTVSLIPSQARSSQKRRELISFSACAGLLVVVVMLGLVFNGTLATLVQHVFVVGSA